MSLPLRTALRSGEPTLAVTLDFPSADAAEFLGRIGADAVALDAEHHVLDDAMVADIARATALGGAALVVKVPGDARVVGRYLDVGVEAFQIAQVTHRSQIDLVVAAMRYAPDGSRGVGRTRASYFGHYPGGYAALGADVSDRTALIVQIESEVADAELTAILDVPDVDAVFVGAFDISASLGLVGQLGHPRVQAVIETVIDRAHDAGKAVGLSASTAAQARAALERGATYLLAAQSRFMSAGVATMGTHTGWTPRKLVVR